jgi:hypothetical protein
VSCSCKPKGKVLSSIEEAVNCVKNHGTCDPVRLMESSGLKYIGQGVSRLAFRYNQDGCDCVVKIAKSNLASYQNDQEIKTWKNLEDRVRDLFVPIQYWDEKEKMWVVQSKAVTGDELSEGEKKEIMNKLIDEMEERDIRCRDIHTDNVGLFQEKPVMVNYGLGLVGCKVEKEKEEVEEPIKQLPSTFTRFEEQLNRNE